MQELFTVNTTRFKFGAEIEIDDDQTVKIRISEFNIELYNIIQNTVLSSEQVGAGSTFSDFFFNILKPPLLEVVNDILYTDSPINIKNLTTPYAKVKDVQIHYDDYYMVLRVAVEWDFA